MAVVVSLAAAITGVVAITPAPAHAAWRAWTEIPGGGSTFDAPAITTTTDGSVWVLVRGTNNRIYFNRLRGSGWSGWHEVPGNGFTYAAPAVTGDPYGDLNVTVRGTDGYLYLARWYDDSSGVGTWYGWDLQVGEPTPTWAPTVMWNPSRYRYETYIRKSNNRIYSCFGYYCSTFSEVGGGGSTLASPAAGWWPGPAGGYGYLVVRGTDDRLWRTTKTQSVSFGTNWWTWHNTFTTWDTPSVAVDGVGNLDVVARGTDNGVYWVRPSSVTRVGTLTTPSPVAAAHTRNGLCLVARQWDERIVYTCGP
jgi:hypothetical protein